MIRAARARREIVSSDAVVSGCDAPFAGAHQVRGWRARTHSNTSSSAKIGRQVSAASSARAAASSFFFSAPTLGYWRSRFSTASTIAAATTSRVNHLLSAGTTNQGAQPSPGSPPRKLACNRRNTSAHARRKRRTSSSSRGGRGAMNRFFCSLRERSRKTLRMITP